MGEHTITGFGYQGKTPADLQRLVAEKSAVVVDVRAVPYSRLPGWNRKALQALLGAQYEWLPDLGNLNYRTEGAPVEFVDKQSGRKRLHELLQATDVILLCYEADESQCHRSIILQWFRPEVES